MGETELHWIFGYGSLVFRPGFAAVETRPGRVRGFVRRFWQHSSDHRGTPKSPGRVVTLVPEAGAVCWGMAYGVEPASADSILAALDFRERAGYKRIEVDVELAASVEQPRSTISAVTYRATETNRNFAGPAPLPEIAAVVAEAVGPSGANRDYVLELAKALREIGAADRPVFALADLL